MKNGVVARRREKFIKLMVNAVGPDDMIKIYKSIWPTCKKDSTARVQAYKLLQNPDISNAIEGLRREKEEIIKAAQKKEIERIAIEQIISENVIDAKLSSIVTGAFVRKRKVAAFNATTKQWHVGTVEEEPDESAIVAAARQLYKRKGSYAPIKIANTNKEGEDLPPPIHVTIDYTKLTLEELETLKSIHDKLAAGH